MSTYRGITNKNNPQCRRTSAPRPYVHVIPQRTIGIVNVPATRPSGTFGRQDGRMTTIERRHLKENF